MGVIKSHSLAVGIVGIPNAGKSTLFNSITKCSVPAENFPFCTIDKNVGMVKIPDKRLYRMAEFFKAEKIVPSAINFVDIAGLVKGASKGEGLGNQFLSHIRECDVIMYVLRAFSGEKVVHVYDRVDPLEDLKIVQSELILKDIDSVENRLNQTKKLAKPGADEKVKKAIQNLEGMLEHLGNGKMAIEFVVPEDEKYIFQDIFLLTNKRMMYVLNVKEGTEQVQVDSWVKSVRDYVHAEDKDFVITVDVKIVGELSDMDEAGQQEYLEMLKHEDGTFPTTVDDIIKTACRRLNLLTFFTGSQEECNAWTIEKGATIQAAMGAVHTDLAKNFITADVVNVDSLIDAGGWANAKEKGIIRNYGKEYLVQDGDYVIAFVGKG
jgi:GTP-binding protein YchF